MTGTTEPHAGRDLITAYVTGDTTLSPEAEWALEGHLENCAQCREHVAEAVAAHTPAVNTLLDDVWTEVAARAPERPAPARASLPRTVRRAGHHPPSCPGF